MKDRLEKELRNWLKSLGITNEEVLQNTPRRWMEVIEHFTEGYKEFSDYKNFELVVGDFNQMVVVETGFASLCEHHLLPYFGKVFVAYLPTTHIVGVSKIIKLVSHLSKRLTIQERLTQEIADILRKNIPGCLGTAVVIHAFHTCVGIRYKEGWLTTSSLNGVFKHNPYAKQEFIDFIKDRIRAEVKV
jgi:GTP cyclohydrolase I